MNSIPQLNDTDLELLSAYIDRQLSDAQRMRLEARLGQEPVLRAALDDLRITVAALRALESVYPPRAFTIDAATVQRPPVNWWGRLALPFGGLITTLVIVVLVVGLLRTNGSTNSATVASAPTSAPAAPAQLQIQTYSEPTQAAAAAPTAAPAGTAIAAPTTAPANIAASPVAPAAAAPAPAATAAPVAEAAAPAAADSQVAGAARTNEHVPTVAPLPASEPAPPLTTPAISSPGTTTLQQAPALPAAQQTGPPVLPIALIVLLVVGGVAVWMRQRK